MAVFTKKEKQVHWQKNHLLVLFYCRSLVVIITCSYWRRWN